MDVLSTNSSSEEVSYGKHILEEEIHEYFKNYKTITRGYLPPGAEVRPPTKTETLY